MGSGAMMWIRMILGLGLFTGAMGAGWWLHRQGRLPPELAARLVRWIIIIPSPVSLCLSFWRMDFRSPEPWALPLLGLLAASSTLIPAFLYVRRSAFTAPQAGSFLTAAYFSNLGYFGAFTAFALYGEAAYALCMLYLIFFTPAFYTLGFGIAARYGKERQPSAMENAYKSELRLFPFLGMAAGALLSLAGMPRPAVFESLNHVLIPVTTSIYLATIGAQLTFSSPRPWLGPCLAMCAVKFIYTPAVAWLLANLFGVDGLPRAVVMIEASAPVAVSPLILPLLFGLDRRLANALWLFTTIAAIPWYLFLLPLLPRL
jgi:predicted permease